MKKFFSFIFLLIMISSVFSTYAFANDKEYRNRAVKMAYIEEINEDGTNIGTDTVSCNNILVQSKYDINFSIVNDNLSINGQINNIPFFVSGEPITCNENQNIVLYDGNDNYKNYKIAFMSLERNLNETPMFFSDFYKKNSNYNNIIKLYLQPVGKSSLALIEIFLNEDLVPRILKSKNIKYDSKKSNELLYWFVKYYKPMKTSQYKGSYNLRYPDHEVFDFSKTYSVTGIPITFNFVVETVYTVPDITKNGDGVLHLYFSIVDSSTTSTLSSQNSSTQHYLNLKDLNVRYHSMKDVYCLQEKVHRYLITDQRNLEVSRNFSVSFGYNVGPFSIGSSNSFNRRGQISDQTPKYKIDDNIQSIESGYLPKTMNLNKTGAQYGMEVMVKDNSSFSHTGNIVIEYEYVLENLYTMESVVPKKYTKNYSLRVI